VDGIDELLDNLPSAAYFAPKVAELRGAGETLCVSATDTGTSWRITLEPERFWWEHDGAGADTVVRGAAPDLLLMLYGRLPSPATSAPRADRPQPAWRSTTPCSSYRPTSPLCAWAWRRRWVSSSCARARPGSAMPCLTHES